MTQPIATITQAMCDDGGIHVLRELCVTLNGLTCRVQLTFCSWMTGARYAVITRAGETCTTDHLNTQDEAEQKWLKEARGMVIAGDAMLATCRRQMRELENKLNGVPA